MANLSYPPWTDEEIDSINNYQKSRQWFPVTCGTTEKHQPINFDTECTPGIESILIATKYYLYCPDCDYKQCHVDKALTNNVWKTIKGFF